jgi:DNA-binding response OmpR family regulator
MPLAAVAAVPGDGMAEGETLEAVCCFPDPLPPDVGLAVQRCGCTPWPVADAVAAATAEQAMGRGWAGAVVIADGDGEGALAIARHLRDRSVAVSPLLLLLTEDQMGDVDRLEELYDDFCVVPPAPREVEVRLARLLRRAGRGRRSEVIEYGPLQLNLETYQAAVAGRVLDLTYMEYELLRFLASHPTKVFTRETLLSRVWGYEYYGGARTVDVHVRRVRAKLGEEHAHLIQTVRSVGYRFGQVGWVPPARGR